MANINIEHSVELHQLPHQDILQKGPGLGVLGENGGRVLVEQDRAALCRELDFDPRGRILDLSNGVVPNPRLLEGLEDLVEGRGSPEEALLEEGESLGLGRIGGVQFVLGVHGREDPGDWRDRDLVNFLGEKITGNL